MSSREFLTGYRIRQFASRFGPAPSRPAPELTPEERKGWLHAEGESESGNLGPFFVVAYIPNLGEEARPYVIAEGCFYDRFAAERWARILLPELDAFKFRAARKMLTPRST